MIRAGVALLLLVCACGSVAVGPSSTDAALESDPRPPVDAHHPALEVAGNDVGGVEGVDTRPNTSCIATSYRDICMTYPGTGASCLRDCRSPTGGLALGADCSLPDVPHPSFCVSDCAACP